MDELKGALIRRRALIAAAPGNEEPSSSRAHPRTSPSDMTTTSRTTSRDGAADPGRPLRRHRGASLYRSADRKSTRLNSSHRCISYAVFCLKKKKKKKKMKTRSKLRSKQTTNNEV